VGFILKGKMLNFTQGTTGPAIIYSNTITNSSETFTDFFLFVFQSTYSKRQVLIQPTVDTRNERFIQFTVGATGLTEMKNWTYQCWNIQDPCQVLWNTTEDFWEQSEIVWNICEGDPTIVGGTLIDEGQMYLTPA